ncbi:MAG: DinB family protein [Acidobacteriota bacterium]|nr:DinB family protein [Blastocatellia bacterium]MDW8239864.1 DinB family protein [Acidobacteriota bacterium]
MRDFCQLIFAFTLLLVGSVAIGLAQDKTAPATQPMPEKKVVPEPSQVGGFRAEYLRQIDDVQAKVVKLADAVSADKYTWRPAEGVRSISEVYMHLAAANFFILRALGIAPPEGTMPGREMEKVTDKNKVLDTLKASFDHVRKSVMKMSDADMDKAVKLFGRDSTHREALMILLNHMHEHLGQSIAYARMNKVTPPWSEGR